MSKARQGNRTAQRDRRLASFALAWQAQSGKIVMTKGGGIIAVGKRSFLG